MNEQLISAERAAKCVTHHRACDCHEFAIAESRQRTLDLATRLEETDRRACAAEQQFARMEADKAVGQEYVAGLEQEARLNASMLARQTDLAREAEAKLAVAWGLLKDSAEAMAEWRKYRERPGLPSFNRQEANMWAAQQKAEDFLADPSQATAQYREALIVFENIKHKIEDYKAELQELHTDEMYTVLRQELGQYEALLGDAAQEEKL